MKHCLVFILLITNLAASAQAPAGGKIVMHKTTETMGLDTNKLAVDPDGNKLHFYQYMQLIRAGKYNIRITAGNGFPLAEYQLEKVNEQQIMERYAMLKKQMSNKSAMLQDGNKLPVEPLLVGISKEQFDNKIIVAIFFQPGCDMCNTGLDEIGSFLKDHYDPQKMIIVAISNGDQEATYSQLTKTPIPNARLIFNGQKVKEAYWMDASAMNYVVTNKDHIIQFTISASGGIVNTVFKSKMAEVLK